MELYTVGGFFEVFDLINKETVYVSTNKSAAIEVMERIEAGLDIPEYLL